MKLLKNFIVNFLLIILIIFVNNKSLDNLFFSFILLNTSYIVIIIYKTIKKNTINIQLIFNHCFITFLDNDVETKTIKKDESYIYSNSPFNIYFKIKLFFKTHMPDEWYIIIDSDKNLEIVLTKNFTKNETY